MLLWVELQLLQQVDVIVRRQQHTDVQTNRNVVNMCKSIKVSFGSLFLWIKIIFD